jgi:hypothetical protein
MLPRLQTQYDAQNPANPIHHRWSCLELFQLLLMEKKEEEEEKVCDTSVALPKFVADSVHSSYRLFDFGSRRIEYSKSF